MQTTARTSFSSPQINGRNDAFASTLTPAQPCRLTALRILRTSHHGQSTKSLTSQINHLCHIILLSLHQQGSSYWSRLESLAILLVRIGPVLHAATIYLTSSFSILYHRFLARRSLRELATQQAHAQKKRTTPTTTAPMTARTSNIGNPSNQAVTTS